MNLSMQWKPARADAALKEGVIRIAAFTLIEIMVALGIIAVVLSVGIPFFVRERHKDSMRAAVGDIVELCQEARNHAVLNAVIVELRINPADRTISVVPGSAAANSSGSSAVDATEAQQHRGSSASLTRKISDHILFEFLEVNREANQDRQPRSCFFYSNGTCDELHIIIRSDQNEVRKITTDMVTGIADVDVVL